MTEKKYIQKVPARTAEQILQDRMRVAEIAATADLTHKEIAEILTEEVGRHITERQVKYDLEILRRAWLESNRENFDTVMRKEEVRLDLLEAEAWDAWRRSQGHEETETLYFPNATEDDGGSDEEPGKAKFSRTLARKKQFGNPKILDTLLRIQQERRKLLGIYPTKESEAAKIAAGTTNQLNLTKVYYGVSPLSWPGANKKVGVIIEGETTDDVEDQD